MAAAMNKTSFKCVFVCVREKAKKRVLLQAVGSITYTEDTAATCPPFE